MIYMIDVYRNRPNVIEYDIITSPNSAIINKVDSPK